MTQKSLGLMPTTMKKERSELEISIHKLFYRHLLALEEEGCQWSDEYGTMVAYHFDHNVWINNYELREWWAELEEDEQKRITTKGDQRGTNRPGNNYV